jgi:hypothetical protein
MADLETGYAAQTGRFEMTLYMVQFAHESWAAQTKKPENRVENVGRASCEAVGGKFIGGCLCFVNTTES